MKRTIFLAGLIFAGVLAWRIGNSLSADALGMAVGILFGMLAGMPAALLVLVAQRRSLDEEQEEPTRQQISPYYPQHQPPVIIVTGGPQSAQSGQQANYGLAGPGAWDASPWQAQRAQRQFTLIGAPDEVSLG